MQIILWQLVLSSAPLLADDLDGIKLYRKVPTKYSNGFNLENARRELSEYRIYLGPSHENIRAEYLPVSPIMLSNSLQQIGCSKLNSPIFYMAVTAISRSGQESDLSEIFLPEYQGTNDCIQQFG